MKYAIIIVSISLAISIILGAVLVLPKYQKLSHLRGQIVQNKVQLENQNKYIQQLKAIDKKMEEKQEFVSKVNSALPSGADTPSLLKFLEETAAQSGVTIKKADWQERSSAMDREQREKLKGKLKEYSIGLDISGSYFAFRNFLVALEKSARLIEAPQVSFSINQESEQAPSFRMTIKIYSY